MRCMPDYTDTLRTLLLLIAPEIMIDGKEITSVYNKHRSIYLSCETLLFENNFTCENWTPVTDLPASVTGNADFILTIKDGLTPAFSHQYLENFLGVYLRKNYKGFAGLPCYDVFLPRSTFTKLELASKEQSLTDFRLEELRKEIA